MAIVKFYPSLAPVVDPAKADVPVGEYVCRDEPISFHESLSVTTLMVRNKGDRPVQVGSHFHFFEVNRALVFDRLRRSGSTSTFQHPQRSGSNLGTNAKSSWRLTARPR